MALFVLYQKTSETETHVEYQYGKSETELNHRLILDKTDPIGRPKHLSEDRMAYKVISRVLSEQANDQWPDGGVIQS